MGGNRAPSCWLRYTDYFHGDIIMQDILVPKHGDTPETYYCTLQWNTGNEAGGYCGIQSYYNNGKGYIFSLWKSTTHPHDPIQVAYKGEGTVPSKFGGEGTGLKSMNETLGWEDDQWYTHVMRKWDHKDHTFFGYWVHDQTGNKWTHLITMNYPSAHDDFLTSTGCFIEDWAGTGEHQREVHLRHGFKRRLDHSWFPFTTANFSVIQEAGTANYNNNYNAAVVNGHYLMQSGGNTKPSLNLGTRHTLHNHATPSHPRNRPIHFSIMSATHNEVTWHVDQQETPQFSYSVSVDRDPYPVAADVDSETRSVKLNVGSASEVEVTLEDILGRKVTRTMAIR